MTDKESSLKYSAPQVSQERAPLALGETILAFSLRMVATTADKGHYKKEYFVSEEKKQKTFMSLSRFSPAWLDSSSTNRQPPARHRRRRRR
jgi:hypothetical protein